MNPLDPPSDHELLQAFAAHFHILPQFESVDSLIAITRAFATLPYENLSKIIRHADTGRSNMLETPGEIFGNHVAWGTGGTCFSLTATLLHLVRSLGFDAQPILADRPYGPDTHCALRVLINGQPHLIDPGFLLVEPIPLQPYETTVATPFHSVILSPATNSETVTLSTEEGNRKKSRLTFKTAPVDAGQFLKAWEQSFDWDMMKYPVLTKVVGSAQHYLRGTYRQTRTASQVERTEIPREQLLQRIAQEFGIAPEIVRKALEIVAS